MRCSRIHYINGGGNFEIRLLQGGAGGGGGGGGGTFPKQGGGGKFSNPGGGGKFPEQGEGGMFSTGGGKGDMFCELVAFIPFSLDDTIGKFVEELSDFTFGSKEFCSVLLLESTVLTF